MLHCNPVFFPPYSSKDRESWQDTCLCRLSPRKTWQYWWPHVHITLGSPSLTGDINKHIKEVLVFNASLSADSGVQSKQDNIYREQSCFCGSCMVRDSTLDTPEACLKLNPKYSGLRREGVGGWEEWRPDGGGVSVMVTDTEETIVFRNRYDWKNDKLKQTTTALLLH